MFRLLLFVFLLTATTAFGARVDTLAIPSAAMHKTYRAAVVLPASYAKNKKASYPVLYLLHGAYGHFADWLKSPADKQLVHHLADQYNLIIVLPEGETFSFYLDSPLSPDSQFETYLTKRLFELAEFENPFDVCQANPGVGVGQTSVVFF